LYRQIPNLITLTRLALTVVFFVLLNVHDDSTFLWHMKVAFVVFLIAALTDFLDGYLARAWKVESAFGRVVDPFVDKLLICGAFIFFSSNDFINVAIKMNEYPNNASINVTGVQPWMAVVIIAREFLVTSIRGLAESKGIDFRADWAGKIKMIIQSIAVGAILVDLACVSKTPWVHHTRNYAIWTTVILTALSATTYIMKARKVLKD